MRTLRAYGLPGEPYSFTSFHSVARTASRIDRLSYGVSMQRIICDAFLI
jgi:hypothetical protein